MQILVGFLGLRFFCGEEDQQMLFNLYPSIILLSFSKNENQVLYRGNKTTSPQKAIKLLKKWQLKFERKERQQHIHHYT